VGWIHVGRLIYGLGWITFWYQSISGLDWIEWSKKLKQCLSLQWLSVIVTTAIGHVRIPQGNFRVSGEDWDHRLADSNCWNIDLLVVSADVMPIMNLFSRAEMTVLYDAKLHIARIREIATVFYRHTFITNNTYVSLL